MKRIIPMIAVLAVLILSALAFAWWSSNTPHTESSAIPPPAPSPAANVSTNSTSTATSATVPLPEANGVKVGFTTFLNEESKSLDSTHVDLSAAEERVLKQAAQMGETEVRYARDLVLSPKSPANLRVTAMYSLMKVSREVPGVPDTYKKIILQPTNSDRAEPHTIAEHENVQAKTFAIMAVDALADQAATDPKAREELIQMGTQARDSTIQNYILQKVRGLPPL